jgi:hypothetical protein
MNGSTASNSSISKWTQILTNPGARIFAIGNSDAHFTEEVANAYTWCDIGEAVTHSSVYSALENGHSVVTNGPLIAFTIGDKKIGDTVTTAAENVFLDIGWDAKKPEQTIQKIEVYSNQGLVKNQTVSGIAGSTTIIVSVTPQRLYVRLRGIFSNGEAYTNPMWVRVCGVNGIVGNAATGYPLPYSTVKVEGTGQVVETDYAGQYQIYLAPGTYTLTASHMGFNDRTYHNVKVEESGVTTLYFQLTPKSPGLPVPYRK